jgi:hypothetical protein
VVTGARGEDLLSPPFVLSKKIKPLTFYIHQGTFKIPIGIVTSMQDYFGGGGVRLAI